MPLERGREKKGGTFSYSYALKRKGKSAFSRTKKWEERREKSWLLSAIPAFDEEERGKTSFSFFQENEQPDRQGRAGQGEKRKRAKLLPL